MATQMTFNFMPAEEPVKPDPYLEIRRKAQINVQASAPKGHVGPLLVRLTGVDPVMVAPYIELLNVPPSEVTAPGPLEWSSRPISGGFMVKVWDPKGTFAFSMEPTATEGRVLVFCHLS